MKKYIATSLLGRCWKKAKGERKRVIIGKTYESKKRKEKESKRARREDKPFENPREQIGDSVPVNGSCFGSE